MPYTDPEHRGRLVLSLPVEEREAFERWAAWGGKPRLSMTAAARELFKLAVDGKANIDRKRAAERAGKPGRKPAAKSPKGGK